MLVDSFVGREDGFGDYVFPGAAKHKGDCVCQETSVINCIETFMDDFVSGLDVEKPSEGTQIFQVFAVTSLWVSFFEIESSEDFFELFVEVDKKRYIFDDICHFSIGFFVLDCDVFGEMFESNHHLIGLMGFEEMSEGH